MAKFDPDKLRWKRICINKNLWTDKLLPFPAGDKDLSWPGEGSWVQPRSAEHSSANESLEVSGALQKHSLVRRGWSCKAFNTHLLPESRASLSLAGTAEIMRMSRSFPCISLGTVQCCRGQAPPSTRAVGAEGWGAQWSWGCDGEGPGAEGIRDWQEDIYPWKLGEAVPAALGLQNTWMWHGQVLCSCSAHCWMALDAIGPVRSVWCVLRQKCIFGHVWTF